MPVAVEREGYERTEHLGAAGSEQGRDIVAWREGARWAFQCKQVRNFGPKVALACELYGLADAGWRFRSIRQRHHSSESPLKRAGSRNEHQQGAPKGGTP